MTRRKLPFVTYDDDADVLYVCLSNAKVATTRALGDLRLIDYSADGQVIGVEFVSASAGVDLSEVPFRQTIESAIGDSGHHIKMFA